MGFNTEQLGKKCLGLCLSEIWPRISSRGCTMVLAPEGQAVEDEVTTHLFIELLRLLNENVFSRYIDAACDWFANERNFVCNPFFITTLAQTDGFNKEEKDKIINESILKSRRSSGLIELFTSFIDGGSQFSTLWAVKILLYLQEKNEYQEIIESALRAVRDRWEDVHRNSFKSYYLELTRRAGLLTWPGETREILNEIINGQKDDGLWDESPLNTAYVVADLITIADGLREANPKAFIEKGLEVLFDLNSNVEGIPAVLQQFGEKAVDSLYLQTVIRTVMSGVQYLKARDIDISQELASRLLWTLPSLHEATNCLDSQLALMEWQYGGIAAEFEAAEDAAQPMLAISPFEKNVFIMMPFRQEKDEHYEDIERIIKDELEKLGLRGWLATDKDLSPTLWGNVSAFMVGCRYGIAVFTRKEDVTSGKIEPEFNPNVSLELGFMLSRGKKVLILKDSALETLNADLMGHLYKEFDLRRVKRDLPCLIQAWGESIAEHAD